MDEPLPPDWAEVLAPALGGERFAALENWLGTLERAGADVMPPRGTWLRALRLTPLHRVKAVILGQDPYHGPGQATGLAFSVPKRVALPPSLRNIYRELEADTGIAPPSHGDLTGWAREGVLLLNTCLTVSAGLAGSHAGRGWEEVTDAVLRAVAACSGSAVFVLWGRHALARAEAAGIGEPCHRVISSPHPSPLSASRGFFGSRPFSRTNALLSASGSATIDWSLPALPQI
jgi:uracil-DNA glycosylase